MKPTLLLPVACAITTLAAPLAMAADKKEKAPAAPAPVAAPAAPAAKEEPKAPAYELPPVVAVVEGEEIKKEELEQALQGMLGSQGATMDQVPKSELGAIYHSILDQIISSRLIAQKAAKVEISDAEVNAQLDKIKAQIGGEEEFKKQLAASGQTLDKVKADIKDGMRGEKWITEQVKDKANVTDAEAEEFYKQNPEKFQQPETVRASHILIKVPESATPQQVIEKEKQARSVMERVKKGEDFNKVAGEVSEDPSAKQNNGDLGFFPRGQMVKEFADAAFAMKKDDISEPVRSQFGYHIIKLTDKKPSETVALDTIKPRLMGYLKNQKMQKEVEVVVADVRKNAKVEIKLPPAPAPEAPALAPAAPEAAPAPAPAPAPKAK